MGKQPTVKQRRADQRAAKLQAIQEEQARARRNRWVIIGVSSLIAVGLVAWPIIASTGDDASAGLAGVQTFSPSQGHVSTPVTYEQDPPVGGEHDPAWLNCGVYTQPVRNENAVHALEHGAVWVTYRPDLPSAQVAALADAVPDTYAVLSPYPRLEAPVVVSAWGKQLVLGGADTRLEAFIREYRQGPDAPEPGASCTGGVGAPGA